MLLGISFILFACQEQGLPPAAPEPEEAVLPEVVPEAVPAEAAEDSTEPPPDSMNRI